MNVDPETMPEEDRFPDTKTFVVNYNKISTRTPVPNHCLGFSYIRLEYYELEQNFDDI